MVVSYSSNAFVNDDLFGSLKKIAKLGFGGIEIMCDRPHLYPPDASAAMLLKVSEVVKNLSLKITNLNCFTLFAVGDTYLPSWIEPDPARRQIRIDHTIACLKIARELQCEHISIPPGGPPAGLSEKADRNLFHRGLEKVLPLAEELGINLLIEPEPGLLIENTAQISSFVKEVASDCVGINFDAGHFYCVGEDPSAAFESLFEMVGHVHIEDIAADRVHEHLIPGYGAMDFDALFHRMKSLGYGGDICLELYPYVDRPVSAGRESLMHLLPILQKYALVPFLNESYN